MDVQAGRRGFVIGPYYVLPSEMVQAFLERARQGEDVAVLMAELYETASEKADYRE